MDALDDLDRLASFSGELLSEDPDAELDAIVAEAAHETGYPIALVSLVLRRTQYFRAQIGLPADLAIAGATDRCSSFCQFVVASGQKFEVTNALLDDRVPKPLVDAYGIRAYLGIPLIVNGQTLGSLCVMDIKANALGADAHALLAQLALRASTRLSQLRKERAPALAIARAVQPVFGELRNLLMPLQASPDVLRVAVAELAPLFRVVTAATSGKLAFNEFSRAAQVLADAELAQRDVAGAAAAIASATAKLLIFVEALQHTVALGQVDVLLEQAIEAASRTAHHVTKLAGGVSWERMPAGLQVRAGGVTPAVAIALSLRAIAEHTRGRDAAGIRGRIVAAEQDVTIELSANLPEQACTDIVLELNELMGPDCLRVLPGGFALRWKRVY
jgi:GAF domain